MLAKNSVLKETVMKSEIVSFYLLDGVIVYKILGKTRSWQDISKILAEMLSISWPRFLTRSWPRFLA